MSLLARTSTRAIRHAGLSFAILAALWGLLYLVEFAITPVAGWDNFFFSELSSITGVTFERSASIWNAVLVAILGFAPLFLSVRRIVWVGELLILVPLAISILSLVAEVFRVSTVNPAAGNSSSILTVFTFLLLEVSLLFARRDRGWMLILTSDSLGGSLARRLLPIAVLVPFGMAWVRLLAEQAGLLSKNAGGVLYSLMIIFVQSILIMWYAVAVNRNDRKRKEAEAFVRSLLRIGTKLNSTLDIDSLLSILVQQSIGVTNAESGLAGLRSGQYKASRFDTSSGLSIPFQLSWQNGEHLPGWFEARKIPYRNNVAQNDHCLDATVREFFAVRSVLSIPILDAHGEVIGFFELYNKRGGKFSVIDEDRLLAVAQSASNAIQNALAYLDLQEVERALKSADRRKNEFLATLAHELRNPLRVQYMLCIRRPVGSGFVRTPWFP